MKRWKAILACAVMTVIAAPGVASAVAADAVGKSPQVSSVASDDDLRGVFSRMKETGELSAKDRAILLTRPEIAEQVYLPVDEPAEVVQAPKSRAVAAGCTYADRYVRYKSTTRLSEVRWNVRVDWCYTGSTVNRVRHYDYISKSGGGVANHRGLLVNQVWHPSPTPYEATVTKQARIELCVIKIGCYGNYYPYQRFTLGNNGSYRVEQRAA